MSAIQTKIDLLIDMIEKYTKKNSDLWRCHHYMFDKPLLDDELIVDRLDYLVMGINPGETEQCRNKFPKSDNKIPFEETSRRNDLLSDQKEISSLKWEKKCIDILGKSKIILGEMFFWSTPKERDIYQYFSKEQLVNHYRFCTEINIAMIKIRQPKVIVFPGISKEIKVAELYNLKPSNRKLIFDCHQRGKLLSFWSHEAIPWVFSKHWSGARLSNIDKNIIKDELNELLNQ